MMAHHLVAMTQERSEDQRDQKQFVPIKPSEALSSQNTDRRPPSAPLTRWLRVASPSSDTAPVAG
jgi:hypothetical protein